MIIYTGLYLFKGLHQSTFTLFSNKKAQFAQKYHILDTAIKLWQLGHWH